MYKARSSSRAAHSFDGTCIKFYSCVIAVPAETERVSTRRLETSTIAGNFAKGSCGAVAVVAVKAVVY